MPRPIFRRAEATGGPSRARARASGALVLAAAAVACDTLHPPVLYNGVADPIEVRASWSDGTASSGSIPPHAAVHLGRADLRLLGVVVTRNGETLLELREGDLEVLSEKTAQGIVGMSIDGNGSHDLSEEQLRRIRAAE